jgi:amino acid adenylation domain-containing protein
MNQVPRMRHKFALDYSRHSHMSAGIEDVPDDVLLFATLCLSFTRLWCSRELIAAFVSAARDEQSTHILGLNFSRSSTILDSVKETSRTISGASVSDSAHGAMKIYRSHVDTVDTSVLDIDYRYSYKCMESLALGDASIVVAINYDNREGYIAILECDPTKYSYADVERLRAIWKSIHSSMANGTRLDQIARLEEASRHMVTVGFNRTEREYPQAVSLVDLLQEQARNRGNEVAVIDGNRVLSFENLIAHAAAIADGLNRRGAAEEDCIGVFVEPGLELATSVWGVLAAGGAYLPLSPDYPDDRLRQMIEDSRMKVVITLPALHTRLAGLLPEGVSIMHTDRSAQRAGDERCNIERNARPNGLAYVIYTSGSTGKPKGAAIEHRSIVNQMLWLSREFALGPGQRIMQKTPISFDAAQWEILASCCGATVVMGAAGIHKDPERLIEMIRTHRVTMLQCVPTLLQALADGGRLPECDSLTRIFSGGEALHRRLADQCVRQLPSCALVNLYGPTECTINTSAFAFGSTPYADGREFVSIGKPIDNLRYYILDDFLTPVGIGETGELYIAGDGLARGYLDRPELSAERFIDVSGLRSDRTERLYKTGDLASWNADGNVHCIGRTDDQIKIRGYRVELGEIKSVIESHDWIRRAAVVAFADAETGDKQLAAFVELDPKRAALMDQGNHDVHHQSKASKAQVLMQLASMGCREDSELVGCVIADLPAHQPSEAQRRLVFARKTYRFYEGGAVRASDILSMLAPTAAVASSRVDALDTNDLGRILRYFGAFDSAERLLPKYGYASPGALYATQMYLEIIGFHGIGDGIHYYHPRRHKLYMLAPAERDGRHGNERMIRVHFIGKRSAIEPIYKNNVREVLAMETGHMLGLFDTVLAGYGLGIEACDGDPAIGERLGMSVQDFYFGAYRVCSGGRIPTQHALSLYVQSHPQRIADLPAGFYRYDNGALSLVSRDVIGMHEVVAINQGVYARSSFGIALIAEQGHGDRSFIGLGRELQRLQTNQQKLGLMSAGYSSDSGADLPSARALKRILGPDSGASYFALGGRVSEAQIAHEGMNEDSVHMEGPTEMLRRQLGDFLPDYMLPHRTIVVDSIPLTVNGKIDNRQLVARLSALPKRPHLAPRDAVEQRLSEIWAHALKRDKVSIDGDFFELGGNSLISVALISIVNREFGSSLPLQAIFQTPTIATMRRFLASNRVDDISRLVPLQPHGRGTPIYCWPGLGGYCMNLLPLADKMGVYQPFFGVQTYGINPGESPYSSVERMATEDLRAIRARQPRGPYRLWGYSFGARVAYETAYQLEREGEMVAELVLIAPGSPKLQAHPMPRDERFAMLRADYADPEFLTILYSVFSRSIRGESLECCLETVRDRCGFIDFVAADRTLPIERESIERIVAIVEMTYPFAYGVERLRSCPLRAPITIVRANGDRDSFLERETAVSNHSLTLIRTRIDHYGLLDLEGTREIHRAITVGAERLSSVAS